MAYVPTEINWAEYERSKATFSKRHRPMVFTPLRPPTINLATWLKMFGVK